MTDNDMNFMLIPGELSAPNKRSGLSAYGEHQRASLEQAYGSTASSPGAAGPDTKQQKSTTQINRETTASSDDYAKSYREKQRTHDEELKAKETLERETTEKALRQRKEKMEEDTMRVRARELGDQIRFWRGQQGQGGHDEHSVRGNIAALEQELNGIDAKYWS